MKIKIKLIKKGATIKDQLEHRGTYRITGPGAGGRITTTFEGTKNEAIIEAGRIFSDE